MAYPTMWLVIFFTTAAAIQLDWDTAATSDLSGEEAPYIWAAILGDCTLDGDCMQSPNYPQNYDANQACTLHIDMRTAVPIAVVSFTTESGYDELTVNGAVYSGGSGPSGVTPSGSIYWTSDHSIHQSGWRLCMPGASSQWWPPTPVPPPAGDCSFCVNSVTGEPDGCYYDSRPFACVNAAYDEFCIPAGTVYTNPITSCEAPEAPTTTERASAVGDPHLSNMAGEHFDIYQPGTFTLLQVPRRPGAPGATLLRVEADARRMGDVCSLYFQAVNISGTWTNQSKPIIFVANARGFPDGMKYNQWMHFGPVDLKVKYRKKGVEFLNIYANSVGRTGYAVGGLLGSDDHTAVSIRPRQCSHSARRATLASSVAETQW